MPTQVSISAVATVFQNVFGRAPTSNESSGWAAQLDDGATSAQLAAVLANSPEGAALVSGLYQQILGRTSGTISSSEVANGQAYLAKGATNGLADLRRSVIASTESLADIRAVYQNVLGRAPSAGEVVTSATALQSGATLAELYASAATSAELTANLTTAYRNAFDTAPDSAVVTYLQQQISSGAAFSQLAAALSSLADNSGGTGGIGTPVAAQITSATQDAAGAGYVDISGTGQPGASVSATVSFNGITLTSPFAVAVVGASGTWSVTNAPGSGSPGAGQTIPNGTYTVTPIETANGQTLNGTATSITVSGSGVSIPDTFNPAESLLASGASPSSAASSTTTAGTAASAASLVQLTDSATAGIVPALHNG